jgi:hypothetical protein
LAHPKFCAIYKYGCTLGVAVGSTYSNEQLVGHPVVESFVF